MYEGDGGGRTCEEWVKSGALEEGGRCMERIEL